MNTDTSTERRFWDKVDKIPGGCWLWTASTRHKGYGAFVYRRDGKTVNGRAHRYSYELHVGPIPDGLMVLHSCDTPACVNPSHLFLGTNTDNVRDMIAKDRKVKGGTYGPGDYERGERHHNARLTEADVREIRRLASIGTPQAKIAKQFGTSQGNISPIVNRKAWDHVE